MRIAVLHHHLKPGGVSRIIKSQLEALSSLPDSPEITLVTGTASNSPDFPGTRIQTAPELDYLDFSNLDAAFLKGTLRKIESFLRGIARDCDILHVHNLNLGKNPLLTYAVGKLAHEGLNVLNHAHDFAEDRPENMDFIEAVISGVLGAKPETVLYPPLENMHYAVLNSHDRKRLLDRGIPETRVRLLPNPVHIPDIGNIDQAESREKLCEALNLKPEKKIFTYPVRVIRRKNIGEYILLCALFADRAEWIVTLPPQNPVEKKEYSQWKDFCHEKKIPMVFGAGLELPFRDIMSGTDACVSTSLREGFGMVFLEPWLFQKSVLGRDIPSVTDDFKAAGIRFPMLYPKLETERNNADFAGLDTPAKMDFITDLAADGAKRDMFLDENPHLEKFFSTAINEHVEANREIIMENYSIKKYGRKLYEIYKTLSG